MTWVLDNNDIFAINGADSARHYLRQVRAG